MEGNKVRVLLDAGCNTVVVKRELVATEKLTGKSTPVCLLDRSTVKYLRDAEIFVYAPYICGTVISKCIDNPL